MTAATLTAGATAQAATAAAPAVRPAITTETADKPIVDPELAAKVKAGKTVRVLATMEQHESVALSAKAAEAASTKTDVLNTQSKTSFVVEADKTTLDKLAADGRIEA